MDDESTPDPVPEGTDPRPPDPEASVSGPAGPGTDRADDRADDDRADGPPSPPASPPHRLRRDMSRRILGGVAAGVARYLDVDVVFVRVAFAVLTLLGGSGALIYLAAWLLVPADDEEHPLAQQWADRRPPRRSLIVIVIGIVVGVIALTDLFSNGPWWPHENGNLGFLFGAAALILALSLVAGSGGNRKAASRLRWVFVTVVLGVAAVVVVAAATVFSIEAASGVPLRGGIGDTQFRPTSADQVARNYRLALGSMNVDLSAVPFRSGTTHVTATVGIGRLVVEVPPGPSVSVVAHSGLGDVEVFGQNNDGLSTVQTVSAAGATGSRSHVVVDADAGVGQVQVIRTVSAYS